MIKQATVTVFGGTGFIGRYVVGELAKKGAVQRVATRVRNRAYFLRTSGTVGQIVPVECNLHDDASVEAAIKGSTHVVNLTGILFEKGKKSRFEKIHEDVPERIARACARLGVERFVHVSALGADKDSKSKYQRSKALGEERALKAFASTTVLRPSIVFGAEDGFFNLFAKLASVFPVLPLIGGGKTEFQPVYVADVAQAVVKILFDAVTHAGKTYELGGPRIYTFRELLELTLAETGKKSILIHLPVPLARIKAAFCELLPHPILTRDQVTVLMTNNIVADKALTLDDLGVPATSLEVVLPTYLARYRTGGRVFGHHKPIA